MINGEGTSETSSQVTSSDPLDEFGFPWHGQKLDGGDLSPISSRYSSCGESEFERYCSANSVMGTPSLCGSSVGAFHESVESEFGYLRSFENFSLGDSTDRNFDDKSLSPVGGSSLRRIKSLDRKDSSYQTDYVKLREGLIGLDSGLNLNDNIKNYSLNEANDAQSHDKMFLNVGSKLDLGMISELNIAFDEDDNGGVIMWRDCDSSGVVNSSLRGESTQQKRNKEEMKQNVGGGSHSSTELGERFESQLSTEQMDSCQEGFNIQFGNKFDNGEAGRCSDEGETSSRCERSEGEDSMFGNGTDDEKQIDYYHRRSVECGPDSNGKNENALLLNSSTAFGADDWDDFMEETGLNPIVLVVKDGAQKQQNMESETDDINFTLAPTTTGFQSIGVSKEPEGARDILIVNNQVQLAEEISVDNRTCSTKTIPKAGGAEKGENVINMYAATNKDRDIDELVDNQTCLTNIYVTEKIKRASALKGSNFMDNGSVCEHQSDCSMEATGNGDGRVSGSIKLEKTKLKLDPLRSAPTEATEDKKMESLEDDKSRQLRSLEENNTNRIVKNYFPSPSLFKDHHTPVKIENHELYDEVVHEMEEILLDSGESPGARFTQGKRLLLSLRDGGSTASTSGSDDVDSLVHHPLRFDGVEVVGARQKKGDVSLSERLVGMKEYTVYKIRVWSGEDKWEVERRYRDFYTLYRRLKTFFANQGWILPSPWSLVERESRKIFGSASPDVIAERSVLIQECLHSLLDFQFSSHHPSALIWFLSPPNAAPNSSASNTNIPSSQFSTKGIDVESSSTLGKTVSLVVKIMPYKSTKQILEAQHYTCSGCHTHFDDGNTRLWELVQTLGWGKPRLCEYSGQLFCALCHTNDTAVLPARVLHFWDFNQYPISQFAKSYLDSIHDQPMLCVSAVNPLLFSKVPALQHVTNVRKKIGAMLPYVHCPFRRTIFKGLGSRSYLLESSDFFALKDLIDLSKGVFAGLPVIVETVSRKILEHITEQCLICCDVGLPCNARQSCDNPSSLIFPFQEGEVERCKSCGLVFHKPCFKKIVSCPCGAHLKLDGTKGHGTEGSLGVGNDALDLSGRQENSKSSVGFLSGLFSKSRMEKLKRQTESDTVFLMGSLPNTSL